MKKSVAWIDDAHTITVDFNELMPFGEEGEPIIYWIEKKRAFLTKVEKVIDENILKLSVYEDLPMGQELRLIWGNNEIPVHPRDVVRTAWFEEKHTNQTALLGAIYDQSRTTFSVWVPTATKVSLCLADEKMSMTRGKGGVWERIVPGDLAGASYQYEVTVRGETVRVSDPYAKGLLANSTSSVVMDLEKTNPADYLSHKRPEMKQLQDAIIYELHIRDATIQKESGVTHRGKYIGLTEENTASPNGLSTGLDYIKQLGITHVQLLPINDFARVDEIDETKAEYNWGYDPLTFQVPEGSYATDAINPYIRIRESKWMIQAFHQVGLAVILDVVYNHVFIMEESPFEKLVPGYYFRYHQDGNLSNGTGVGNDVASERIMVRKFILDSIDFWLREYKVDGFRFDLMGAMDIETMKQIRNRCDEEPFPIILLGEGWDLSTALAGEQKATSSNSHQLPGIRFFNDYFRDTLKGQLFSFDERGYVNGNGHFKERLPQLVSGSAVPSYGEPFVSEVTQTVNYVECHDNHTLWDRLVNTNPDATEMTRKMMHQLATGITLLSQGVPFIHAGQEWFRSKQGVENSYISGDAINQLDWNMREEEQRNIAFIQNLISIRKKYNVFRLTSEQEVKRKLHILPTPDPVFGYVLLGENENIAIFVNPTKNPIQVQLPASGRWEVIARNEREGESHFSQVIGEFAQINPYELVVLIKSMNG